MTTYLVQIYCATFLDIETRKFLFAMEMTLVRIILGLSQKKQSKVISIIRKFLYVYLSTLLYLE